MRLFIGIPLENNAQEQLTVFYKHLKDIKTVKKENLHVTLQFLGDMDEVALEPVKKAIDAACEGFFEFEISSTRISAFPNVYKAKAVWANVDKGAGAVKKLFNNIEKCLGGIEYEKEERTFIPHVTIGRSKQEFNISAEAAKLKFEIVSRAGKVALYSSVLDPSGPVYTRIYERILENQE